MLVSSGTRSEHCSTPSSQLNSIRSPHHSPCGRRTGNEGLTQDEHGGDVSNDPKRMSSKAREAERRVGLVGRYQVVGRGYV